MLTSSGRSEANFHKRIFLGVVQVLSHVKSDDESANSPLLREYGKSTADIIVPLSLFPSPTFGDYFLARARDLAGLILRDNSLYAAISLILLALSPTLNNRVLADIFADLYHQCDIHEQSLFSSKN